jgi:NADH-quinone oxidoreductase subunit L
VTDLLSHLPLLLAQAGEHAAHAPAAAGDAAHAALGAPRGVLPAWAGSLPLFPLLACVLCTLCAIFRVKTKLPAAITVALLALSFVVAFLNYQNTMAHPGAQAAVVPLFDWINFDWALAHNQTTPAHVLVANFSFYIDPLTCLWMLFVTGLATFIALYASEYMSHDVGAGYCRFFMAFNLFVFSMACLVMGDNLLLLFLGWEGVGLCSYLLIGYFYQRPSAVAAGKKAFIMNRIGDLGLSMGIMLTYVQFGTLEYDKLFPQVAGYWHLAVEHRLAEVPFLIQLIPVLFTVGAFGKSAQFPLYVWLPDAMEGPTPVSALIHAATMVTAGVYLVARFFPLYLCSAWALDIVAWGGAITALLAATIGMAQFDIKRIMAYSTVSQLGYMFCGLGVYGATGGVGHVFTHAFFKALLFLACGAVMHGFAGQLDLRKLSGLGKMPGWKIVSWTMLVGCLNLAGFPIITSGFFSKDSIVGGAFANAHTQAIGWILLITAGLTAYYTFRVYFRVFVGPKHYEPGDELHASHDDHAHGHGDHAPETAADHGHDAHDFHPHAPGWAINLVLSVLAIGTFLAIWTVYQLPKDGWVAHMVNTSTAGAATPEVEEAHFLGMDPHHGALIASIVMAIGGIVAAWWLHLAGRTTAATSRADGLIPALGPIPNLAQHKWYVDEIYDFLIVKPLWFLSHILYFVDKLLVDGLVNAFGFMPRAAGGMVRRQQTGVLHDYAVSMAAGITLVVLVVVIISSGGHF